MLKEAHKLYNDKYNFLLRNKVHYSVLSGRMFRQGFINVIKVNELLNYDIAF